VSLTPQELERRRKFITATDAPALLGVSPWVNAADVFIQKTQGVDSFKGNSATDAGNRLEDSVIAWAAEKLGPLNPGDWCVHENGLNACTLDATTMTRDVVEAKTTGIVGPGSPHQWGEEGSDEIPDYYLVQVQAQLLVTGARRAFVPTLIGGRGFVMFVVMANVELQEVIRTSSEQFWQDNVLAGVAPDGVRPSLEILKRMRREPGKVVDVSEELAAEYLAATRIAKEAGEHAEKCKAALIESLGDAEGGKWSGGMFTFFEQSRKETVQQASTFRVLRHNKPKKSTERKALTSVE
jgi:putative phage-type endonuclease